MCNSEYGGIVPRVVVISFKYRLLNKSGAQIAMYVETIK